MMKTCIYREVILDTICILNDNYANIYMISQIVFFAMDIIFSQLAGTSGVEFIFLSRNSLKFI